MPSKWWPRRACIPTPGVTNVAADGVVTLAQAVSWAGGLRLPLPAPLVRLLPYEAAALQFGRVVDTTRLHARLGYQPRFTTAEAIQDFLAARAVRPRAQAPAVAALDAVQRVVRG